MNYKTDSIENITEHFVSLSRQVIFAAIKYYKLLGDEEVVAKLKLAKEKAKILRAKLAIQEKENALNSKIAS